MQEKGLFRVPGFMNQVKELKGCYDRGRFSLQWVSESLILTFVGEKMNLEEAKNIHTVASLLKFYLAELPEPLLTFELLDCFLMAVGAKDTCSIVPSH